MTIPDQTPGALRARRPLPGELRSSSSVAARVDHSPELLLEKLAARIRARRQLLGMTVRELSRASGVSERFLVALEGGHANVSVVRLAQVGAALGAPLATLFDAIEPARAPMSSSSRGTGWLALTGLRGAGKSTIGASAAQRLDTPFVELDERIAARAGMTLAEIFEVHGADFYRKVEREELDRLLGQSRAGIVATGGSLVTHGPTYERLLGHATVVWLKARPEDHFARVLAQGDLRPMADRKDAMRELKAILRARRALHERAHHVVDTSALGLFGAVDEVVALASGRPAAGRVRRAATP